MTSCLISASIWKMRSTLKLGRARIALAASLGTMPAAASVSVAATSTASQVRKRFSSLQMRAISGLVYRGIKEAPDSGRELGTQDCKSGDELSSVAGTWSLEEKSKPQRTLRNTGAYLPNS